MTFSFSFFLKLLRNKAFYKCKLVSGGKNVSHLHYTIIYRTLFLRVHNLKLSTDKNWTHFLQTQIHNVKGLSRKNQTP